MINETDNFIIPRAGQCLRRDSYIRNKHMIQAQIPLKLVQEKVWPHAQVWKITALIGKGDQQRNQSTLIPYQNWVWL